jgi:hypothetical protein
MRMLLGPMGLGDHIITAGLVNKLSLEGPIAIPCYPWNESSVSSFHAGNERVKVVTMISTEDKQQLKRDYESIEPFEWRDFSKVHAAKRYPVHFYEAFGTYEDRYTYCPIKKAADKVKQLPEPKEPFVFIHDDHRINHGAGETTGEIKYNGPLSVYKPPQQFPIYSFNYRFPSILQYADILMAASEIHCIESSFFNLCEALQPQGKGFLFINKKPYSSDFTHILKKKWEIIN